MDFGFSQDSREKCRVFVGDKKHAAPEVLKEKEYTQSSEIYSLGIVLIYLLTGMYPYLTAKIS